MTQQNEKKPSEQALLAEYQVCQREASDAVSSSWQSGIILFVTTLTLAGTIIYGLLNTNASIYRTMLIFILGIFSVTLLIVWKKYLTRQHFVRRVMFHRMQEVERDRELRKCLYVSFLDGTLKDENNPINQNERTKLLESFGQDAGRKPKGFKLTILVVKLAIWAWITIMILELIILIPRVHEFLMGH